LEDIVTVILAAGKGTRMKSDLVKVLHPLLGLPMLSYPIELSLNGIKAEKTIVVVGHQANHIQERFKDLNIEFALQEEQLGTGHAVLQAAPFLHSFSGTVLILCGDVPLVKLETLHSFIDMYKENESVLSVLTAIVEKPLGYGRILRTPEGWLKRIVEEKDCSEEERTIREINTGIFCVKASFLKEGLKVIGRENAQREYYLTDLVGIARERGFRCSAHIVENPMEVMGINTRVDLAMANEVLRQEKVKELMLSGVTVVDPKNTYVEKMVEVGKDTIIYPYCILQGKTKIGEHCTIEHNSKISDSTVGDEATIHSNSIITESKVEDRTSIGPFALVRSMSKIRVKQKNIKEWSKKVKLRPKKMKKKRDSNFK